MIKNDRVYGVPLVQYKDTKANIEALSGIGEGAIAYATDSNEFGSYDGTTWTWGQSGSTAPATTAANDFQVGDGSGNWIKKTLAETITILRTALDSAYAALSHTHVAGDVTSGTLDTARLPLPTTTTIGGVKRNTGSAGEYVTGIDASGNLEYDTPAGSTDKYNIAVSVSSNNLIVALKNKSGSTPSSSDPVTVWIGGSEHLVTSALSVQINAGTNTFNAGSSELATKLINYFVYLGYNATDGIVIGISRIPSARFYSDFSTTATNEKYCKISTITNATSSDNYINIGRISATLSAGTGYNWSISGTGDVINRPIFITDELNYAPTIAAQSGTPTTVTLTSAKYILAYDELSIALNATVVNKGTAALSITYTTPFSTSVNYPGTGYEIAVTGVACAVVFGAAAANIISARKYDGTTLWANNYQPVLSIRAVI